MSIPVKSPQPLASVILINGFPGVGKLTIARALQKKIGANARLIDNHLLIDPVEAIEPGRNFAHYKLRKAFRHVAFEGIRAIEEKEITIIMTQCLAATPNDLESFQEHAAIACARGVPFVNINITCDEDTNKARLCSNDRKEGYDS
jgi:hypothetical protein